MIYKNNYYEVIHFMMSRNISHDINKLNSWYKEVANKILASKTAQQDIF